MIWPFNKKSIDITKQIKALDELHRHLQEPINSLWTAMRYRTQEEYMRDIKNSKCFLKMPE
jgi:hypothetical protein